MYVIMKKESKMDGKERIRKTIGEYISHLAVVLPDDVRVRLEEMERNEDNPLSLSLYEAMRKNQEVALSLKRPCCQDTGLVQYWIRLGALFPYINDLEEALIGAVRDATENTPLRPNAVKTFDECNTKTNTGSGAPYFFWDILPDSNECEIYVYLAGGGCSLPGKSVVLMPSSGYSGIADFVLEQTALYGPNACPPLLVGIGVGATSEIASLNAKKALMRPVGSHNPNEKVRKMEDMLFRELNAIGIGVQGLGGKESVLGVNIENTVRHPATLAVAVSYGCWSFRRGCITFNSDLSFFSSTHHDFGGQQ